MSYSNNEWRRTRNDKGEIIYTHCNGEWVIEKVTRPWGNSKKLLFTGRHLSRMMNDSHPLPLTNTLSESKRNVGMAIKELALDNSLEARALRACEVGDQAGVLEYIMEYIDMKFYELENKSRCTCGRYDH